jgi:hypothetical protein
MRKFKITFKTWNDEVKTMEVMIDVDFGPDIFPDMLGTIIKEMMFNYNIDEILEIKNEGSVTREEYEAWLETEDGKYFMSL